MNKRWGCSLSIYQRGLSKKWPKTIFDCYSCVCHIISSMLLLFRSFHCVYLWLYLCLNRLIVVPFKKQFVGCWLLFWQVSAGVFEYVPSPVDEEVKVGVIRDTLRLMDPAQRKQHIAWVVMLQCVFVCVCLCAKIICHHKPEKFNPGNPLMEFHTCVASILHLFPSWKYEQPHDLMSRFVCDVVYPEQSFFIIIVCSLCKPHTVCTYRLFSAWAWGK